MRDYAEQLEQRLMLAARAEAQRGRLQRVYRATIARRGACVAVMGVTGTAATVATALVLTAGAAPSVAQALPILAEPPTNVSTGVDLPPARWLEGANLADARAFTLPYGTGYVIPNTADTTLCIVTPSLFYNADGTVTGPASGAGGGALHGGCGIAVSTVEQQGFLLTWYLPGNSAMFIGVLPADASASLTADDGSTASIPIVDGIATVTVHQNVTISIHIGSLTRTVQFGPSASSTGGDAIAGVPGPSQGTTGGATSPTGPAPATGASSPTD
jgi:hypothetical protein